MQVTRKWVVVYSVMVVCLLPMGCGSSSQIQQMESRINDLSIKESYRDQEIKRINDSINQINESLRTMKFDIDNLRKSLLDMKNGGEAQLNSSQTIDKLIEQLRSAEIPPNVIEQLRSYGKQAVNALALRLKDTDVDFLRHVEIVLSQMSPEETVPVLVTKLDQGDLRNSAARILGELKDRSAVIPLAEHLKDKDQDFVFVVADALVKLKDRRGIPVLIENIKSENAARRALSFDSLSKATGLTFDYKPYLSAEERVVAVKQWEVWWLKESDKFEFK